MLFQEFVNPPENGEFNTKLDSISLTIAERFAKKVNLRWKKYNNLWTIYEGDTHIASYVNYNILLTNYSREELIDIL